MPSARMVAAQFHKQLIEQCSFATLSATYVNLCTKTAVHAQQGSHMPFVKTAHGLGTARPRLARKMPVALKIASALISPSHASHVQSSPQTAHIVLSKTCSSSQASKKAHAPQDLRRLTARPLLRRRTGSYTQTSDGTRGPAAQAPAHGAPLQTLVHSPFPDSAQAPAAGPNLNSWCRNDAAPLQRLDCDSKASCRAWAPKQPGHYGCTVACPGQEPTWCPHRRA